MKAITKAELQ